MANENLKAIPLVFPARGFHESSGIASQPEGTTPQALNVRGYDARAKRDRGAQRCGMSKYVAGNFGNGAQAIDVLARGVIPGSPPVGSFSAASVPQSYQTYLILSPPPGSVTNYSLGFPGNAIYEQYFYTAGTFSTPQFVASTATNNFIYLQPSAAGQGEWVCYGAFVNAFGYTGNILNFRLQVAGGTRSPFQGIQVMIKNNAITCSFQDGGSDVTSQAIVTDASTDYFCIRVQSSTVTVEIHSDSATGHVVQRVSFTNNSGVRTYNLAGQKMQPLIDMFGSASKPMFFDFFNIYTYAPVAAVVSDTFATDPTAVTILGPHSSLVDSLYLPSTSGGSFNGVTIGKDNPFITSLPVQTYAAWQCNFQASLSTVGNDTVTLLVSNPTGLNGDGDAPDMSFVFNRGTLTLSSPTTHTTFVPVNQTYSTLSALVNTAFQVQVNAGTLTVKVAGSQIYTTNFANWSPQGLPYTFNLAGGNTTGGDLFGGYLYHGFSVLITPPAFDTIDERILVGCAGSFQIGNDLEGFSAVTGGITGVPYTVGNEVSVTQRGNFLYVVDGTAHVHKINLSTFAISDHVADNGSMPQFAKLTALYRDRLWFSRITGDEYNYVASRSGDPADFNFAGNGPGDVTLAIAGNNTTQAGLLGDVITAMIPYGDVSMIFGMTRSMAVMQGDPAAGGSIDMLSREVGIATPNAWARNPEGDLYFLARDGLYEISGEATRRLTLYGGIASAAPKALSLGRLDSTLGGIDFTQTKVEMAWDFAEHGLKIYLIAAGSGLVTKVIFWEKRKDAFWVDQYPAGKGPVSIVSTAARGSGSRTVLIGGWDGYLRKVDISALDDDGTAISSLVRYPPVQLIDPMTNAKIVSARMLWGDVAPLNVAYSFFGGNDPVSASLAAMPLSVGGVITSPGYQTLDRTRMRAACIILQISNGQPGTSWAIERAEVMIEASGRVRT